MRALLGGVCVALAIVLAGCGGDGSSGDDPLTDALGYLPADASAVAVVDTDLSGEPVKDLERALGKDALGGVTLEEVASQALGEEAWKDLRDVIGNEAVIGTPGNAALNVAGVETHEDAFVVALHVKDTGALEGFLDTAGFSPKGSVRDAKLWEPTEDEGFSVAIDGDNLVAAESRESLGRALGFHEGPEEERFPAEKVAGDSPVRAYVNLQRLVAQPEVGDYAKVPWVAALRSATVTVKGDGDTLALDGTVNTDPSAITDEDLPLPTGSPALDLTGSTSAINGASANQSRLTTFLLELLRAGRPTGRFATDIEKVEQERGIDFDEEVLRQFNGPSASKVMPGGSFAARSTVADPARMEKTLELIAPDLGRLAQDLDPLRELGLSALLLFAPDAPVGTSVLEGADIKTEKIDGERALYRMSNLNRTEDVEGTPGPDEIVLGLIGDVFVVADNVDSAKAIVGEPAKPVEGLTGASVAWAQLTGDLRQTVGDIFLDVGDRELKMSAKASRERLQGSVRLAPLKP